MEINISKILLEKTIIDPYGDDSVDIVRVIKEICNQVIDLCAENAEMEWDDDYENHRPRNTRIDKESILETKNQIKQK